MSKNQSIKIMDNHEDFGKRKYKRRKNNWGEKSLKFIFPLLFLTDWDTDLPED